MLLVAGCTASPGAGQTTTTGPSTASTTPAQPGIDVEPASSKLAEPVSITAKGLDPRAVYTLTLTSSDSMGVRWSSSARFRSTAGGTLDLDDAKPRSGSYHGVDAMVVLADLEGNAFCVMEHRAAYRSTGPIAALPLDSADPDRDAAFWAELSGWVPYDGVAPASLRHPSGRGPVLELCSEPGAKQAKSRMHLDVRAEPGEGDLVVHAVDLGARRLDSKAALPWTVLQDPSGNEFCILDPHEP
ncbi:MAG TPA: VOC family protein [Segeticoccus sp.]|nr:VOC family protein [Segeticoccus sp.]